MKKTLACFILLLSSVGLPAQSTAVDALTKEEEAAVAAILATQAAQNSEEETTNAAPKEDDIIVPEADKNQALADAQNAPQETGAITEEEESSSTGKCLTVAFVDIDVAFNEHPRTIAVKEQIRLKIVSKEDEVRGAKQLIAVLAQENAVLAAQLRDLKPFYERIVVEPHPLLPKVEENADELLMGNVLNRLTFSGAEILSTSPLNTPAQLEDLQARIASNKKIIAERSIFIDNYRYATREEILQLEKKEVNEILQDIYKEIKSFAQKRNIGAIVRKDDILYGEKPVNVTKDFVNRLKKSKKYRKRGK